ncbi:hypothetical protein ZWY2020_015808 [Hordeum vulgare]|nr:hypothetical protein ZWY2020_015808 [Hordeum vulgare]
MPSAAACHAAGRLNDDLLLHMLRFMPEARDVARTSVLSRRWRDITERAPVLHFCIGQGGGGGTDKKKIKKKKKEEEDGNRRHNEFIHSLLARRANSNAYIDTLDLSSTLWPGDSQADAWLRHAMEVVVGSLKFYVWAPFTINLTGRAVEKPKPRLQLPPSTRATTMSLQLYYGILLLPPTVEFHALTDLSLCAIRFIDGDDDRLGRLLSSSSCCPRLRKLTLRNLSGLKELLLNGELGSG